MTGPDIEKRLKEIKRLVPEVSPFEALELQQNGAVIVDVRESDEISSGSPKGSLRINRGFLELKIPVHVDDLTTPLITICASGRRSLFAAADLRSLGYENVRSLAGGFQAWQRDQLPVETVETLGERERQRYSRHLAIPEIGETGQLALKNARVLVIGAGGLGSPAAYYLAAAGVGTIGIVDHDIVERSNLQRQILHTDDRIGSPKVDSAKQTLTALNPEVRVETYMTRLDKSNVEDLLSPYDVILDGTDNFASRYLINDASVRLRKPVVHGAVFRFEGQTSVFWPAAPEKPGPCYRCLFPSPPPPGMAPSCSEAGVLGILPGVIGLLQATETIKLITGAGRPLIGRLLHFDALAGRFNEFSVHPDSQCRICSGNTDQQEYEDFRQLPSPEGEGLWEKLRKPHVDPNKQGGHKTFELR